MEKKNKRKIILAVGIVVAIVIVGALLYFVVFQEQEDTSKFIGTWKEIENSLGLNDNAESRWIFYENGTLKRTTLHFVEYPEEPDAYTSIYWETFKIEGGRLYLTQNDGTTVWLEYEFSTTDSQLTLTIPGYATLTLNKEL